MHPWSHCRRRVLLGYPRLPTAYPQVFKGEMHCLQLQLCLEKLPILGLFIRSVLLIKDTGKRGRNNAKELQSRENRGKRNQLSGCLETAWVLLEDCFFLYSELFLPPQCNLPSPGPDWTANCTIPAVEDGIDTSN